VNREVIVHDRESAPSLATAEISYEIRRRPEVAIPVALVLGFFLGLFIRQAPLVKANREPDENEPSWSQVLTDVRRLLR